MLFIRVKQCILYSKNKLLKNIKQSAISSMLAVIEPNNNEVVVNFQPPFPEECHKIVQMKYVKLMQVDKTNKTLIGTSERSVS